MNLLRPALLSLAALAALPTASHAAQTATKDFACTTGFTCSLTFTPAATTFYIGAVSCQWSNKLVNLVQANIVKKANKAIDFAYPFALTQDERNARGMFRTDADAVQVLATQELQVTLQLTKSGANSGTCYVLLYD